MGFANRNFHQSTGLKKSGQVYNQPDFFVDLDFVASGQRMLATTPAGLVYADHTDPSHALNILGFLLQSGDTSLGVMQVGAYRDPSLLWDVALPVWLGTAGQLTQVRPTTGFVLQVATVLDSFTILLQVRNPVLLI